MKKALLGAMSLLAGLSAVAEARPLTIEDVVSLSRTGSAAVSPDGRWLVWDQRETDLKANKGTSDIWRLDLTKPGAPVKLVADPAVSENSPAFSPDGKWVYYAGKDGVYRVPSGGGAPSQVLKADIGGFKLSPTGDRLLVWADRPVGAKSLAESKAPNPADAGSGRTYDQLFVRHWDTWADGQRSQLFVLPIVGGKAQGDGTPIIGSLVGDTPSKPFGGGTEISWSPDGKTVYFALREAGRIESLSTNLDIFAVSADGSTAPVNLTADNKATDTSPTVSPDGRWLAWTAMKRAGYESDKLTIMLRDLQTGQVRALTDGWDRSAASIDWAPDGRSLYVAAQDTGDEPLFRVDIADGKPWRLTGEGTVGTVIPTGKGVIYTLNTLKAPNDFWRIQGRAMPIQLTHVNDTKLAGIDWPTVEHFSFKGAKGDTVWAYALKPAGTPEGAKVPMAFLIHGGPQGSFGNGWSYRWNPALWTGHGYGAVMVDFHGSTGYGQGFTDAINQDWGGKPLDDLKAGFKAATTKFAWLDGTNACAAGGSYGGYMINWIAGNWPDGFKCLVNHDGVFDARAMAYETEELWFDEWEHGGPYFQKAAEYEKWNPVNHVADWKAPILLIHGEKDFRIPYTQGLAAFTAAQRREIPSKLLIFPDENHWVLKPKNSIQWYHEVLGWMDRWTAK